MDIQTLKSELGNGAWRSKFLVDIPSPLILKGTALANSVLGAIPIVGGLVTAPKKTPDAQTISALAKSTTLPEKAISTIEVHSKGLKYIVKGVHEYGNKWDVTFYNTSDLALRNFFDAWMNQVNSDYNSGISAVSLINSVASGMMPTAYMTDISISLLGCNGSASAKYTMYEAYPVNLSSVSLDSSTNELSDFTVTFAYTYWQVENPQLSGIAQAVKTIANFF